MLKKMMSKFIKDTHTSGRESMNMNLSECLNAANGIARHGGFVAAHSALSRGVLKKKNGRDTIHFKAAASNTELLFRIIHYVNQLSVYGAVSNWCEQFVWTEEEKGREKSKESVTKGLLQAQYLETDCGKTFRTSNHCPKQFDSQGFAKAHRSCTWLQLV